MVVFLQLKYDKMNIILSKKSDKHAHLVSLTCLLYLLKMSRVVRKPDFCICENKDADQLRGNREADQRLCFRYSDSMILLLSKSKISSL